MFQSSPLFGSAKLRKVFERAKYWPVIDEGAQKNQGLGFLPSLDFSLCGARLESGNYRSVLSELGIVLSGSLLAAVELDSLLQVALNS